MKTATVRRSGALAISIGVHAIGIASLAWIRFEPKPVPPIEPDRVVFDLVDEPSERPPATPSVAARPPHLRSRNPGVPPTVAEPTIAPTQGERTVAPAGLVDRFASFRAAAPGPIDLRAPGALLPGSLEPSSGPLPSPPRELPRIVDGRGGVKMKSDRDGEIEGFWPPPPKVGLMVSPMGLIGISGTFDLTDSLMRAVGMDPYRYEKHRLAEATREERFCRMVEGDARRKREAIFHLKERLETIGASGLPDVEQRVVLFQLWDDCIEERADGGVPVGAQARATVMAYIRRAFSKDGPRPYPPTEIAMLNRRRVSREPFDPYGDLHPDAGAR